MSSSSITVTDRHFDYLAARTQAEPPFLKDLKKAATEAGIPQIWISPEQASFMQILLRLVDAKEVVEVGTLAGYSAIAMAQALPADGRVRTIEVDRGFAAFALEWVARSEVSDRVEVICGDGRQILPGIPDATVDAAFVDADKVGYPLYARECLRVLRPGGLLLVDNAFAFGELFTEGAVEESVHHLRAFNDEMASLEGVTAIIVPIGDGCWVGVKDA
ncbi:MAG: O-methyltransferase [Planctomycetota bacterium]|jgi:predicted O-methyltransferase YrrM